MKFAHNVILSLQKFYNYITKKNTWLHIYLYIIYSQFVLLKSSHNFIHGFINPGFIIISSFLVNPGKVILTSFTENNIFGKYASRSYGPQLTNAEMLVKM